jgi:hypothetical protein
MYYFKPILLQFIVNLKQQTWHPGPTSRQNRVFISIYPRGYAIGCLLRG